jgi:hypothetical protein
MVGPFRVPFFGGALQLALSPRKRNYEIFEDLCTKYGPILGLNAGFTYFGKAIVSLSM